MNIIVKRNRRKSDAPTVKSPITLNFQKGEIFIVCNRLGNTPGNNLPDVIARCNLPPFKNFFIEAFSLLRELNMPKKSCSQKLAIIDRLLNDFRKIPFILKNFDFKNPRWTLVDLLSLFHDYYSLVSHIKSSILLIENGNRFENFKDKAIFRIVAIDMGCTLVHLNPLFAFQLFAINSILSNIFSDIRSILLQQINSAIQSSGGSMTLKLSSLPGSLIDILAEFQVNVVKCSNPLWDSIHSLISIKLANKIYDANAPGTKYVKNLLNPILRMTKFSYRMIRYQLFSPHTKNIFQQLFEFLRFKVLKKPPRITVIPLEKTEMMIEDTLCISDQSPKIKFVDGMPIKSLEIYCKVGKK